MRAMVIDRLGPPQVLHEAAVPEPAIGPGELRPRVGTVLDLAQLPEAHRLQESGHTPGTIVLRVA